MTDATPSVQDLLDLVGKLQMSSSAAVRQDRLLTALLPPPADPAIRKNFVRLVDSAVPLLLERNIPPGASIRSYELTIKGWLQSRHRPRVLKVLGAFLEVFRQRATAADRVEAVTWKDLSDQGLTAPDYALTCFVAQRFHLHAGASTVVWDGKNPPQGSWTLPIDIDDLIDVVNAEQLADQREGTPYFRTFMRKTIEREMTGHVLRVVDIVFDSLQAKREWPRSRSLQIKLAREHIDLGEVTSTRFLRGNDVYTENARTTVTLSGLLFATEAAPARAAIVDVLRFIGEYSETNPEAREVSARVVLETLGPTAGSIDSVAQLLANQGSLYINLGGPDVFDPEKAIFYLSPRMVRHKDAKDLWDIVLNEEEESHQWNRRGEGRFFPEPHIPKDDQSGPLDFDEVDASSPASVSTAGALDSQLVVEDKLGRGYNGDVYRGRDRFGRAVAIKFLRVSAPELELVIRHAKALANAGHPAVVTLFTVELARDPETDALVPVLVMELLDGQPMEDSLSVESPIPANDAVAWASTILDVLQSLHNGGAWHGDIHGKNLMVTPRGLRIIDLYVRESHHLVSTRTVRASQERDVREARGVIESIIEHSTFSNEDLARFRSAAARSRTSTISDLRSALSLLQPD